MIDLEDELMALDEELCADEESTPQVKNSRLTCFMNVFYTFMIFIGIIFIIFNCIYFRVQVPTASMSPTISVGEQLLVLSSFFSHKYNYGDILVFNSNESDELLVKRLIGKPGDTIEFKDGVTYRNGKVLTESYLGSYDDYSGSFQVPDDCYFFLGDNRANSYDSRYWLNAYVKEKDIRGRVVAHVYPKIIVLK